MTFASLGQLGLIVTCDLSIWVLRPGNKAWTALNIISSIFWLTGFAFVLYSRLHLIIPRGHGRIRQGVLILLVVNTIAFHTPGITATIIGAYGSQQLAYDISKHAIYIDIGFVGQDVLLSSLYILYFWRYMHDGEQLLPHEVRTELRRMLIFLLCAFALVLISSILSLVLLGKWLLLARYTMLPLVNVLNLQVEFFVLNRLVRTADIKSKALQRGNFPETEFAESMTIEGREVVNLGGSKSSFPEQVDVVRDGSVPRCAQRNHHIGVSDPGPSNLDALERQYLGRGSWRGKDLEFGTGNQHSAG